VTQIWVTTTYYLICISNFLQLYRRAAVFQIKIFILKLELSDTITTVSRRILPYLDRYVAIRAVSVILGAHYPGAI
jgi:hypothetical protein